MSWCVEKGEIRMPLVQRIDLRHAGYTAGSRTVADQLRGAGCRPAHPRTPAAPDLPPAGAAGPSAAPEIRALEREFAEAGRRSWAALPDADTAAAIDAGMLALVGEPGRQPAGGEPGNTMAATTGQVAATVQRQGVPPGATAAVDWSPFGLVIPVLAGSAGAGASVLAAALTDTLQLDGCRTMLVDAADPVRSGLAMAARNAGPWVRGPHPAVSIRFSWRAQALLAQMETWLPVIAPGMVPSPRFWHPGVDLHVTVVDVGHDSWRIAAHPLVGAGEWLRAGTPAPRPVLAVRASRPSLIQAEQVLSRLEPWIGIGAAAAPVQLVVMGARRWPPGVVGSAGRRLAALLPDAVFVPHDAATALGGVNATATPPTLRRALTPLLHRWGALGGNTKLEARS